MFVKIKRLLKKDIISNKDKFQHDAILGTLNTGKTCTIDIKTPIVPETPRVVHIFDKHNLNIGAEGKGSHFIASKNINDMEREI